MFVNICFKSFSLIVDAVYFPLGSDIGFYNLHVESLENLLYSHSSSKFLILGDYNLPVINWSLTNNKILPQLFNISSHDSNILSSISPTNLIQFYLLFNRMGSLLDLVFSNVSNVIVSSAANSLVPLDYKYYPALDISLLVLSVNYLEYKEYIYDFYHCDYNCIISLIASVDWNGTFNDLCINNTVDIFYSLLHDIINTKCSKICQFFSSCPLWFSSELKKINLF